MKDIKELFQKLAESQRVNSLRRLELIGRKSLTEKHSRQPGITEEELAALVALESDLEDCMSALDRAFDMNLRIMVLAEIKLQLSTVTEEQPGNFEIAYLRKYEPLADRLLELWDKGECYTKMTERDKAFLEHVYHEFKDSTIQRAANVVVDL